MRRRRTLHGALGALSADNPPTYPNDAHAALAWEADAIGDDEDPPQTTDRTTVRPSGLAWIRPSRPGEWGAGNAAAHPHMPPPAERRRRR